MAAKVSINVTADGSKGYWVNKKTGSRYKTVKYIAGTKLVEVTTERTAKPYLVEASSLSLVLEKKNG